MADSVNMPRAIAQVNTQLATYLEAESNLWNTYVDPREAYLCNGEFWEDIGAGGGIDLDAPAYRTCEELFRIQSVCRILSRDNEFCINGHTNRVNYTVGKSHQYTIVGRDETVADETVARVQDVLDKILKVNKWKGRQKEIKHRDDRDGETFIRKFRTNDGLMKFRFIEPRSIKPPANAKPFESFGVRTDPDDIESVTDYYVNGDWVSVSDIQHRKHNVDSSYKRGFPLFYPVRKNLTRAVKLLRNMSVATEIQTAIALIRKHQQATATAVKDFVNRTAEPTANGASSENVLKYGPGSIIDAPRGQEYDVPKQLDPSKTVAALQAELRSIASRLVMPEFMLTSDASNANFSSTMVAEGPAVINFHCLIDSQIENDTELIEEALEFAAESGLISSSALEQTRLTVKGPSVQVRDALKEAQVRQVDMGLGILSKQTASAEAGRDFKQEQANIENDAEY